MEVGGDLHGFHYKFSLDLQVAECHYGGHWQVEKVVDFVVVKSTNSTSEVVQIFIKEIVILHGVPKKIILDRYAKFTSMFWKELFANLGIELAFSTTYHPQKDGKIERVNQILEDMLRMYVMHQ